jgi:hypothetical protein
MDGSELEYLKNNVSKIRIELDDDEWLKLNVVDDYEVLDLLEDYLHDLAKLNDSPGVLQEELSETHWRLLVPRSDGPLIARLLKVLSELGISSPA